MPTYKRQEQGASEKGLGLKLLTITSLLCVLVAAGCKATKSEVTAMGSASPSPSLTAQSTPAPASMTPKEHWDEFKRIWGDEPYTPEDYAEIRRHLAFVVNSKLPERHRAAAFLKSFPKLEAMMPTGDVLSQTRKMCADLSGNSIAVLTEELKKSLHDPASLQDFQVKKCAPNPGGGTGVFLRATYRAKNTYGALTLNEDRFLAVRSSDEKAKYTALVWVDEK